MTSAEHVAISLLAMAETLRTQQPPKFKMAIKCVMACFKQQLNDHMTALCHYELGKLYFFYTENQDTAKMHLETSYTIMCNIGDLFREHRLQALCLICEIYIGMNHGSAMLSYLKVELLVAKQYYPPIYSKMLLLYAEICAMEENAAGALQAIEMGLATEDVLTQIYFRLTKHMVNVRFLGITIPLEEVNSMAKLIETSLDQSSPSTANVRIFLLATQSAHLLNGGQCKSVKPILRQLQQEVQSLCNVAAVGEGLMWCEPTVLTVLACTMTVISTAIQLSVDRAHKYYGVAMKHFYDAIRKSAHRAQEPGISRALDKMKLVLEEIMSHLNILACKPKDAIGNIRSMVETSSKSILLSNEFYPTIHVLLSQYAIYSEEPLQAEKHLLIAVKTSMKDRCQNMWANLFLALYYLSQAKTAEFCEIMDRVTVRACDNMSVMIRTASRIVHAYQLYLFNKPAEFRTMTTECLDLARGEDIIRIHTLCILLFFIVFPTATQAIPHTISYSKKSEDYSWLIWTYKFMKDNNLQFENISLDDARQGYEDAKLALERAKNAADDNQLHSLIQWEEGDPTIFLPNDA